MGWEAIPGWFDFSWVYDEAVETAPRGATLVEIGVAFGRSLAYLARRAIDAKRDDLRIVGVDPWRDDWVSPDGWSEDKRPTWGGEHAAWARAQGGPFSAFIVSMRTHAPEELERVDVMRCTSLEASRAIEPRRSWMVFLDGDHRYAALRSDILWWEPHIINCGILAGHDYSTEFPGVVRAVDELVPNRGVRGTTWRRP